MALATHLPVSRSPTDAREIAGNVRATARKRIVVRSTHQGIVVRSTHQGWLTERGDNRDPRTAVTAADGAVTTVVASRILE